MPYNSTGPLRPLGLKATGESEARLGRHSAPAAQQQESTGQRFRSGQPWGP